MIKYTSERRCFSMASKGQKYKKHNLDIKEIILNRYLNGESSVSLGKEFGISQILFRHGVRNVNGLKNIKNQANVVDLRKKI